MAKSEQPTNATSPESSAGVPPAVAGPSRPRTPNWASVVATFLGVGHLHPGPGTWASVATVLLWAAIAYALPPSQRTPTAIALTVLIILIGIPAATRVSRASGGKDPQFVVIDEVAGQLIALIAVPLSWKSFLVGLILFRVFDIVKPPPCGNWSNSQRAPESCSTTLQLGSWPAFRYISCCIFGY